jgi:hypothetical protein
VAVACWLVFETGAGTGFASAAAEAISGDTLNAARRARAPVTATSTRCPLWWCFVSNWALLIADTNVPVDHSERHSK